MLLKLKEEMIGKIEEISNTNLEIAENGVPVENVEYLIEDLLSEIDSLKEIVEDLEYKLKNDYIQKECCKNVWF